VKRKKKIYLYGTHDTRIVEILQSIGVYRDQTPMIPNFGATIIFELHQVEGEFIVKVFNYYDTLLDPILMKMPTCMNDCKLDQFISVFKPLFPQDWKRECKYGIK
jgi:prostatic aicd phosphatase